MPRYEPIDTGIYFQASFSDLAAFHWETNGMTADFIIPNDEGRLLRVHFDSGSIIRLLDEMPLSTEDDDSPIEGLVSENFAYRVYGAAFLRMQSPAWKEINSGITHYRFVTGWACLDVISPAQPSFKVVGREA